MLRLDGTHVAKVRQVELQQKILRFQQSYGRAPGLAVLLVGADPASQVYVRNKRQKCEVLGMKSLHFDLPAHVSQSALREQIEALNQDSTIDGILVQLPLPSGLSAEEAVESIRPSKDPDGLTYTNLGLLWAGKARVAPCTPSGVMAILEHYQIPTAGQNVVVIGRSNIVGKPMAHLLSQANATVTICHSKTKDLLEHTLRADIVVVAAGQPRFLGKEAFAAGSVVIDVGVHRPSSGPFANKLCGDVRFEELEGWVSAATPVPGGVGPMTIQMLMENTVRLAELAESKGTK
jgi:methylenetetrahydrofolate dehydrogenase (NADP+)/methenyltetrahydrofolate cyclohydrolase